MAVIYYDNTEGSSTTLLPSAILAAGKKVVGLEALTGADLLIVSDNAPTMAANVMRPPHKLFAADIARTGLLVQRKTGTDLTNSIPNLLEILQRMTKASDLPVWLTPIGEYSKAGDNVVVRHEQSWRQTQWSWAAFQGALDAWQFRGGCVHWCQDDDEFSRWVLGWTDKKLKMLQDPTAVLSRPGATVFRIGNPALATLMSFPHVGDELAERVMEFCGGSLKYALQFMSTIDPGDVRIKGIGSKTRQDWRKWFGLNEDEELVVMTRNREEFDLGKLLEGGE